MSTQPIQWPCGHEGQPPCPPIQCTVGLNPQQLANWHEHCKNVYMQGIADERKRAKKAAKKKKKK